MGVGEGKPPFLTCEFTEPDSLRLLSTHHLVPTLGIPLTEEVVGIRLSLTISQPHPAPQEFYPDRAGWFRKIYFDNTRRTREKPGSVLFRPRFPSCLRAQLAAP